MIKTFFSYTAEDGVTVQLEKERRDGSQVHWALMFICSISQSLTVKMTHRNMGATKYHYRICDKCHLLPWCKLQTHDHLLIEISLHRMTFGGNAGAGCAQTRPPPAPMAGLWQVTKWLNKSAGMQVLVAAQLGEVSQRRLQGQRLWRIIQY